MYFKQKVEKGGKRVGRRVGTAIRMLQLLSFPVLEVFFSVSYGIIFLSTADL